MSSTIIVLFHMTKSRDGSLNFKAKDFNFEFEMKEDDNEKLMRTLTKATADHIYCHNLDLSQLSKMTLVPGDVKSGTFMLPVRIGDILGTRKEKVNVTLPTRLTARIDDAVANGKIYKSRSEFLEDAAIKLLLEETFNFENTEVPEGRETKEL